MAEADRRSGPWLACRPGCTQCCIGPFAITRLDALRLRRGLDALHAADPGRAQAVRDRAAAYVSAVGPVYPGDPATGELWDQDGLPESLEDLPCPALDPHTGCCDLYDARPVTCRTFGPATRIDEEAIAACDLCYTGATDEQIAQCAVDIDCTALERELLTALEAAGSTGMTIVAYALALPASVVGQ